MVIIVELPLFPSPLRGEGRVRVIKNRRNQPLTPTLSRKGRWGLGKFWGEMDKEN